MSDNPIQSNTPQALMPTGATSLLEQSPEVTDMFFTMAGFEAGQRMAKVLTQMPVLPEAYHNNLPNCMMLLCVAASFRHYGISFMMVAQQLVPVKGKYGWQAQFVIAIINASKRFKDDLRFEFSGEGDEYGCQAVAIRKDGTEVRGTKVTWKMVKAESWDKNPKWKSMPEQMFQYRAAAFFGRVHAPDLLLGLGTAEELTDIGSGEVSAKPSRAKALTKEIFKEKNPEEAEANGGQPSISHTIPVDVPVEGASDKEINDLALLGATAIGVESLQAMHKKSLSNLGAPSKAEFWDDFTETKTK